MSSAMLLQIHKVILRNYIIMLISKYCIFIKKCITVASLVLIIKKPHKLSRKGIEIEIESRYNFSQTKCKSVSFWLYCCVCVCVCVCMCHRCVEPRVSKSICIYMCVCVCTFFYYYCVNVCEKVYRVSIQNSNARSYYKRSKVLADL